MTVTIKFGSHSQNKMKKILSVFGLLASLTLASAQDKVVFEIADGLSDAALKAKMEQQVSSLLSAINAGESAGRSVNFSGINIDDMASHSIAMLWDNVRFRTLDDEIVTSCLRLGGGALRGYQVRNIEVEMKPLDDTYTDQKIQEVCIDFDKTGRIVDFNLTLGVNQYMRIMREGVELDDLDRRMQILHYVEQFRNAYNQKDINFMDAVFSEDALIITGKVIRRVPNEVNYSSSKPEIQYSKQSKQQYLANLKKVFARQGYINVKFDEIKVLRHGANPNFYGVTLIQHWNSSTYSDKGILFLVWNFENPDAPQINVRTWQPMETSEDDIFTLDNFKI